MHTASLQNDFSRQESTKMLLTASIRVRFFLSASHFVLVRIQRTLEIYSYLFEYSVVSFMYSFSLSVLNIFGFLPTCVLIISMCFIVFSSLLNFSVDASKLLCGHCKRHCMLQNIDYFLLIPQIMVHRRHLQYILEYF